MRTFLFRSVGGLNLLFATLGLGALAFQSWAFSLFPSEVTGGEGDPVRLLFRISQFISIVLLPVMAYLGARLLRLSTEVIVPCACFFIVEIVYVCLIGILWPWSLSSGMLRAIEAGYLNAGFGLQILTGYPLLGLIALYFLHKGRRVEHRIG